MRYTFYLLTFTAFAVTALALPTEKTADSGKLVPGGYESEGANFDDGQWVPEEHEKRKDDRSWYPSKYGDKGTGLDNGNWTPTKDPDDKSKIRRDKVGTIGDDSRKPGEYESQGTNFEGAKLTSKKYGRRGDDGSWRPGKYEGDCTSYDDGKWTSEKYN